MNEKFINLLNSAISNQKNLSKNRTKLVDQNKKKFEELVAEIGSFFLGWAKKSYDDKSFLLGKNVFKGDDELLNPFWDDSNAQREGYNLMKYYSNGDKTNSLLITELNYNPLTKVSNLTFGDATSKFIFRLREAYTTDSEGVEIVDRTFQVTYNGVPVEEVLFSEYSKYYEALNELYYDILSLIVKTYNDVNKFYIESLNDKKEEEDNTEVKVVTGESTTPAVETDNRGAEVKAETPVEKHSEPNVVPPVETPKEKAIEAVRAVKALEGSKEDK